MMKRMQTMLAYTYIPLKNADDAMKIPITFQILLLYYPFFQNSLCDSAAQAIAGRFSGQAYAISCTHDTCGTYFSVHTPTIIQV